MAPEYGRCRHGESSRATSKSRPLPAHNNFAGDRIMVTAYAMDACTPHDYFFDDLGSVLS